MAKTKYKTQEAINIIKEKGVRSLTVKELKEVGAPLMATVKMRLRRLEKQGFTDTPAYVGYVKNLGMKSSIKSKNVNVLRHEVFEAYKFLSEAKTSTVTGAKEFLDRMSFILDTDFKTLSKEQRKEIFDTYHRIENENPYLFQKFGYDQILSMSAKQLSTPLDISQRVQKINETLQTYDQELYFEEIDEGETPWSSIWGGNKF